MDFIDLNTWIITEGLAGTENQCLGITEALGVTPHVKRITLRQPWKTLSPFLGFEQDFTFIPALNTATEGAWPDLLITSGRKAIAAARYIKKASKGKTFTTHIQDPRANLKNLDLVAVPAHDPTRGEHVLVTTASPNRITPECLKRAHEEFPDFDILPSPRIAVLIGGSSQAYTMTPEIMTTLARQLKILCEHGHTLMITTSRRTGAENEKILHDTLEGTSAVIWDGHGKNPYFGILAYADTILVTADSASMLSEACTTGKPVYMINLQGGSKRITKLHENLIKHGALRVFEGQIENWEYERLNDAQLVADEIKKRLKI